MRTGAATIALALLVIGCGGGGGHSTSVATSTTGSAANTPETAKVGAKPPPGSGAAATARGEADGPAATEASPEAPAEGPHSTGELSPDDSAAVTRVVTGYIEALDSRDAARACVLFAPGALPLGELPKRRSGCRASLRASIGTRPADGGPAWRRTAVVQLKPEDLGGGRARVTATVTHHFSDRRYVSVEDDVIYLERLGGRWLLAKPSATLYRAVGYGQPPLRAFSPPPTW